MSAAPDDLRYWSKIATAAASVVAALMLATSAIAQVDELCRAEIIGLLPASTCFAVVLYVRGQKNLAAVMFIAALPLLHEILLTGRRRLILPVLILILM
jgi:hypothetical protein